MVAMKAVVCQVPCERAVTSALDPGPDLGEGRLSAPGGDRPLRSGPACPKAALAP